MWVCVSCLHRKLLHGTGCTLVKSNGENDYNAHWRCQRARSTARRLQRQLPIFDSSSKRYSQRHTQTDRAYTCVCVCECACHFINKTNKQSKYIRRRIEAIAQLICCCCICARVNPVAGPGGYPCEGWYSLIDLTTLANTGWTNNGDLQLRQRWLLAPYAARCHLRVLQSPSLLR